MGRFDALSRTIETVRSQSTTSASLPASNSASIPNPPPILMVPLSSVIRDPDQDRRYFEPLVIQNLAASIQQVGLIDPLSVRPRPTQAIPEYDLLAGEQRHRACELAGLTEIPVRVFEVADDTAADIKSVSNLQRKDLNFWEEAVAIMKMLCRHLDCSDQQVIQLLTQKANVDRGKSQKIIDPNQWRIVEEVFQLVGRMSPETYRKTRVPLLKLPASVRGILHQGELPFTHVNEVLKVKDPELQQSLLQSAIEQSWPIESIQMQVKALKSSKRHSAGEKLQPLSQQFTSILQQTKKSPAWNDPKKQSRLQGLIKELETLLVTPGSQSE